MLNSVISIQNWKGNNKAFSDLTTKTKSDNEPSELCSNFFDFSEPVYIQSELIDIVDPGHLYSQYKSDLDLTKIHNSIRNSVLFFLKNMANYNNDLIRYNSISNNPRISLVEKKNLYKKIQQNYNDFENNNKLLMWRDYCRQVIPLLNRYVLLISNEYKGDFISSEVSFSNEIKINERLQIIDLYLNVIRDTRIIKISLIRDTRIIKTCPSCFKEINNQLYDDRGLCNCGFISTSVNKVTELFDCGKIIPQINSTTINVPAWREWMDNYLCRNTKTYPKNELFSHFDYLCLVNRYPDRLSVINGIMMQPELNIIISLLQKTKTENINGSDYYCMKNIIRHEYYNWPKPIVPEEKELEAETLYINIQTLYPKYKSRKTNINIEILGLYILHTIGIRVFKEDFKIPISSDTIEYSNNTLMQIFGELTIPFVKLI